ncbi:MAG: carboxypeptidase regulatory-like domain-containing protein [Bacteroidota bacterium]
MNRSAAFILACLVPFVVLAAGPAMAQPVAVLEGRVTNAVEGTPIPGATVQIVGTGRGTAAGADGRFLLSVLRPGRAEVSVSAIGYAGQVRLIELVANDTLRLDVELAPVAVALGEVAVEAAGRLAPGSRGVTDVPGAATVLDAEALERFADTDVLRVLSEVPGVTVQEEEGYGLRPNIGIRGTISQRSSGITLMEDGVLIAPAPYAAPAAYYTPPVARMDGLEVRKGSAQIAYGPYTTGGAVNFVSMLPPTVGTHAEAEVRGGTDRARTVHMRLGRGGLRIGGPSLDVLAEGLWDGSDGFKHLARFPDPAAARDALDGTTGYDLWSGHLRARLHGQAGSAFHSVELKVTADGQTSDETYLGLTDADFSAEPTARYVSTAADAFTSDHQLAHLRYVGVIGNMVTLTGTLYTTRFRRDWRRLDAVSDGLGDDLDTNGDGLDDADLDVPITRFIDDPVLYADELAVARGTNAPRLANASLTVASNDRQFGAEGLDLTAHIPLVPEQSSARVGLRLHRDRADRMQRGLVYRLVDVGTAAFDEKPLRLVTPGTPGDLGNRVDRAEAVAAFAEGEFGVGTQLGYLTLSPGLRVEHVRQRREDYGTADPERAGTPQTRENTVTALIPGLGVRFATGRATVFAGLHRGFAPPSSEPGVEAEWSLNGELGMRYTWTTRQRHTLALQVAGFATAYDNLLGADFASSGGTGSGDLFNGGAARVVGAEGLVNATWVGRRVRVPLRLAYTYTDARFEGSFTSAFLPWGIVRKGDRLPYVAPHALTVGLGVESERARLDLRAAYTAPTRDRAGQGPIPEAERIDARLVMDLAAEAPVPFVNLRKRRGAGLHAVVAIRNLLDARYVASRRPAGLRPGLPRTIVVGLRAKL